MTMWHPSVVEPVRARFSAGASSIPARRWRSESRTSILARKTWCAPRPSSRPRRSHSAITSAVRVERGPTLPAFR